MLKNCVGLMYVLLALGALAEWLAGGAAAGCASGSCAFLHGMFGRPWWLWGAVYYSASSVLALGAPKSRAVLAFLFAGPAVHAALIGYGYLAAGVVCLQCAAHFVAGSLLPLVYTRVPEPPRRVAPVAAACCLLALCAVLMVSSGRTVPFHYDEAHALVLAGTAADSDALVAEGKPVLFFSTWCGYCGGALEAAASLPEDKRPVLACLGCDEEAAAAELEEHGLKGSGLVAVDRLPSGVDALPALVWTGPDGSTAHETGDASVSRAIAGLAGSGRP